MAMIVSSPFIPFKGYIGKIQAIEKPQNGFLRD
jgi:hypothetical protein